MLHKLSWCAFKEALFHLVDFSSIVLITHQALLSQKCPFAIVNSQTLNFSMELFCLFVCLFGGGVGGGGVLPGLVEMTRTRKCERVVWEKGRQSRSLEEARGRWVVLGGSPRNFLFPPFFPSTWNRPLFQVFI